MSLLGNGDESSLTSNAGWGMMPPLNSGADWGSSSNTGVSSSSNNNPHSSSSSIGANNSGNNHNTNMSSAGGGSGSSSSNTSCWQTPNSLVIRSVGHHQHHHQMVSNTNNEQALSSSPKLSSSWAQAAGKGLMASSNNSSSNSGAAGGGPSNASGGHHGNSQMANNNSSSTSSNVINQSSSSSSSCTGNNSNNNTGSVSSVSDHHHSSSTHHRSSIANNNNGPNNAGNNFNNSQSDGSSSSYSAIINSGGNNQQSNNSNNNATTGSGSSSAFQQSHGANSSNNNNSSASSSENLSGGNNNNHGGGKRAIFSTNIQDIIGNLSDDVRETLLTEKWRTPVINQDSPWNLPPSPQSSPKDTSQWRCPVNSGTEIWENTVRQKKVPVDGNHAGGSLMASGNGGPSNTGVAGSMTSSSAVGSGNNGPMASASGSMTPGLGGGGMHGHSVVNGPSGSVDPMSSVGSSSAAASSSQAWGQPTHSICGTWGEEEDLTNHWMSPSINPVGSGPSNAIGNAGGNSSLTSINNWSTNGSNISSSSFNNNQTGNNWNNAGPNDNNAPNDVRCSSKNAASRKPWGTFGIDTTDSCSEQNWERHGDNFGTWNADPANKKESGWDKESNDGYKGPVDDGTSVWGNPVKQTKVSNWKDTKFGNNNLANNNRNGFNGWNKGPNGAGGAAGAGHLNGSGNSGVNMTGGPNGSSLNHKSNQMAGRSWTTPSAETPQQRKSPSLWNDDGVNTKVNGNSSSSSWLAESSNSSLLWPDHVNTGIGGVASVGNNNHLVNSKPNKGHGAGPGGPMGAIGTPNSWMDNTQVDTTSHWSSSVNNVLPNRQPLGSTGPVGSNQKLSREIIQSSNHYKTLLTMGFKKDDVENALRNNQMRIDDALKDLKNQFDDDLNRRTNQCALSNDRSRLNSMLNAQQNSSAVQGGGNTGTGGPVVGNTINNPNISSCSNRQMVQLIQMAINAGFLSPQILNQPMSQHNLEVLNELLSQLKMLRTIPAPRPGDMGSQLRINQIKQNIGNLQNQIHGHSHYPNTTANSPFTMMQSNRGQPPTGNNSGAGPVPPPHTPPNSIDFFKPNPGANTGNNNSTGNDLSTFDLIQQQHQTQGSRLQSWKSQYKPDDGRNTSSTSTATVGNNDFIRAPGPLSKQNSTSSTHNNNWVSAFTNDDPSPNWGAPVDKTTELPGSLMDNYDFTEQFDSTWKQPGAKALDDDPRSPLLNLSLPWNNNKPSGTSMLNSNTVSDPFGGPFSSNPTSTWSYTPMPSTQTNTGSTAMFGDLGQTAGSNKPPTGPSKKNTWGNPLNANATDYNINSDSLWTNTGSAQDNTGGNSGSAINKPRPPPGLSGKMTNTNAAGAGPAGVVQVNQASVWNNTGPLSTAVSDYVRFRNLTPQIDGSTLKTLCLQHGPLKQFHLSLNHGVAIVRYASRDQAIKAQTALNNCLLGNTNIIADLPSEHDLQQYSIVNHDHSSSNHIHNVNGGGGGGTSGTANIANQMVNSIAQQQSTNNNNNNLMINEHQNSLENLSSTTTNWSSNGTNASHMLLSSSVVVASGGGNNCSSSLLLSSSSSPSTVVSTTSAVSNTIMNNNNNIQQQSQSYHHPNAAAQQPPRTGEYAPNHHHHHQHNHQQHQQSSSSSSSSSGGNGGHVGSNLMINNKNSATTNVNYAASISSPSSLSPAVISVAAVPCSLSHLPYGAAVGDMVVGVDDGSHGPCPNQSSSSSAIISVLSSTTTVTTHSSYPCSSTLSSTSSLPFGAGVIGGGHPNVVHANHHQAQLNNDNFNHQFQLNGSKLNGWNTTNGAGWGDINSSMASPSSNLGVDVPAVNNVWSSVPSSTAANNQTNNDHTDSHHTKLFAK